MPAVLSRDTLIVVAVASGGVLIGVGVSWIWYRNHTKVRVARQPDETEALRKHNYLIDKISKEFGSDETWMPLFRQMSKTSLGSAQADGCTDMRSLLNELENEAVISIGQYEKLIEDILKPAGYRDADFLASVRSIQEEIVRTLNETSLPSPATSPPEPSNQGDVAVVDGLLLYGESDVELAVQCLQTLKSALIDVPGLTLELYDERGAGLDVFDLVPDLLVRCRNIYILFTKNFVQDVIQRQMAKMARFDGIRKNHDRIIPIWCSQQVASDPSTIPMEFAMLTGLNYNYMGNARLRQLFFTRMKNSILDGRNRTLAH